MKKEQLVVMGLIVAVGLGLYLFGRTAPTSSLDVNTRIIEVLKTQKVPVVAVVDGRAPASKQEVAALRGVVKGVPQGRAVLVVADINNPNDRNAAQVVGVAKPPVYVVIGLDGKETYRSTTTVDAAAAAIAVSDGLTKPPVKIEEESEHEHHH